MIIYLCKSVHQIQAYIAHICHSYHTHFHSDYCHTCTLIHRNLQRIQVYIGYHLWCGFKTFNHFLKSDKRLLLFSETIWITLIFYICSQIINVSSKLFYIPLIGIQAEFTGYCESKLLDVTKITYHLVTAYPEKMHVSNLALVKRIQLL